MVYASHRKLQAQRAATVWPRRLRRSWVRPDQMPAPASLLAAIPSLPRPMLARLTARMIDRMDEIDGDADVEANGDELDAGLPEGVQLTGLLDPVSLTSDDAEDDDPAGGAVDDEGEPDEWRDTLVTIDLPRYAADQTLGPINVVAAHERLERAYARCDRESPLTGHALAARRFKEQSDE